MKNQTTINNTIAIPAIRKLDSTLRSSIALSIGMKLAGMVFGKVEKLEILRAAQVKFGHKKVDPNTGESAEDTMARDIETLCGYYAAALETWSEQAYIITSSGDVFGFSPEAYASSRATPFMRTRSADELEAIAKAGRVTVAAIQANEWKQAEARAAIFTKKAPAILPEIEGHLAMAPEADIEDIPTDLIDVAAVIETAVAKYRAKVAAGQKYDVADMVLFNSDCEFLTGLGLSV